MVPVVRKRRGSQPTQNESRSGKSGCRLFHSVRAWFNCSIKSDISGPSGFGPWEHLNFTFMQNRRSSELDILKTETRAFLFSAAYVPVSRTVNPILSRTAIIEILPAIGAYQYPLAAPVRQFYRCHLCGQEKDNAARCCIDRICHGTGRSQVYFKWVPDIPALLASRFRTMCGKRKSPDFAAGARRVLL
jgi:hypothetical protein